MNTRRKLILGLGASALAAVLPALGQTPKWPRIGILHSDNQAFPPLQAFVQELGTLGYTDGQNVTITYRFAEGDLARLPALAVDLAKGGVDIIFAHSTAPVLAAQGATTSTPIVFSAVSDPVGQGFAQSLSRPGGRITGTTNLNREMSAKRLEILKEMSPRLSRLAIFTSDEPHVPEQLAQVLEAARRYGMTVKTTEVRNRDDFERVAKLLRTWRAEGICVVGTVGNSVNRKLLVDLASQIRLPAVYAQSLYADAGGLVSYGPSQSDNYRKAAHYVDKILKGAPPADMPIQQPTTFELVVNLKAAKALGIKVPNSILLRADRVIE